MDSYYCIVSTPDQTVADLCVLEAISDGEAMRVAEEFASQWPADYGVEVYRGERLVARLGYAATSKPLPIAA